jgi:phosphate transport system substrate-binding protein
MRTKLALALVCLCGGFVQAAAPATPASPAAAPPATTPPSASALDKGLRTYQRVSGVSGNLSSVGSDTLANLMTLWTEAFKKEYPNVNIQVQAAGSSTAPPALTEGTANFGPMSRLMKDNEVQAFEKKYGYKPTSIRVAIDTLAVYVNKDNPIQKLSIPQVDAIFSATRRCGAPEEVKKWGELGLTGSWADRPIQLYGRNSVSGTYGYFKEVALCGGDFRNNVNEQPGSASVVQSVTSSLNGIGYSGIGYVTSGVRPIPLAKTDTGAAVTPTRENALNGSYPLARYLYIYVNKKPGTALPPLEREFLKLVLSLQGQEIVLKDGYDPVTADTADREQKKLN